MLTLSVQSMLSTALYDTYQVNSTLTTQELKQQIQTSKGFNTSWFDLFYLNNQLDDSKTLQELGVLNGAVIKTSNKIARLPTKAERRQAKLDLTEIKKNLFE